MMKKIFVLFLAILIMACFSMPAFAANPNYDNTGTIALDSGGDADVGLSANVVASYSSGGSGATYSAITYNHKGVGRAYGAASDTTYIYYYDGAIGTSAAITTPDVTTAGDSTNVTGTGWEKIGE